LCLHEFAADRAERLQAGAAVAAGVLDQTLQIALQADPPLEDGPQQIRPLPALACSSSVRQKGYGARAR